ncbi:MAG: MATE family efflux transporter [Bacteroidales bacterium]|jgi:MATE family multidrug resistance protein|nr:MATE family efflux transporter [Bacteroidales bacterium]
MKKQYYKNNLSLAIPIILSLVGQSFVQIVDNIMVGNLGAAPLAAVSFAGSLSYNALVVGMGIALALTPIVGERFAQNKFKIISKYFQNSLSLNLIISFIIVGILLLLMPFLSYFGQPKEVIELCKPYYFIITISFIPEMLFLSFKQFLEGVGNTKVSMIITISANILHVILNFIFIYGMFSFPAMGITGAALSTLICRILMPISFFIYVYSSIKFKRYLKFFSLNNLSFSEHIKILRIGLPIASQMFLEFASLFGITLMMGWVSLEALAAYQIVISAVSLTFLISSGISSATTILTSYHYGLKQPKEIRKYFKVGLNMSLIMMSISALCFIFFGKYISMLFTFDDNVIELASTFFIVAGFFQLLDGSQVSILGALRGIKDVFNPMKSALISYIFIALPFAYLFGFVLKIGSWSIFSGFLVGLLSAALLYYRRFNRMLKLMENEK